jgi:hypothetical protein
LIDCVFWSDLRNWLKEIIIEWPSSKSELISTWIEYGNLSGNIIEKIKFALNHTKKEVRNRFRDLARIWEVQVLPQESFLLTDEIKNQLHTQGFAVLRNFYDSDTLNLAEQSLKNIIKGEGWDETAYHYISEKRYSLGLTTKFGWTKFYTSPAHRLISCYPKLLSLCLETYQSKGVTIHPYDLKIEWDRSDDKKNVAFVHTDLNYSDMLCFQELVLYFTTSLQYL